MTRQITVTTEVFARIWSLRGENEETENDILARVLAGLTNWNDPGGKPPTPIADAQKEVFSSKKPLYNDQPLKTNAVGKVRWVDDIVVALQELGGQATLQRIYQQVRTNRKAQRRSVPRTIEATVRRTIEDHSSDSANFRAADLFQRVSRGEWRLR
jgi:hypothetical protein